MAGGFIPITEDYAPLFETMGSPETPDALEISYDSLRSHGLEDTQEAKTIEALRVCHKFSSFCTREEALHSAWGELKEPIDLERAARTVKNSLRHLDLIKKCKELSDEKQNRLRGYIGAVEGGTIIPDDKKYFDKPYEEALGVSIEAALILLEEDSADLQAFVEAKLALCFMPFKLYPFAIRDHLQEFTKKLSLIRKHQSGIMSYILKASLSKTYPCTSYKESLQAFLQDTDKEQTDEIQTAIDFHLGHPEKMDRRIPYRLPFMRPCMDKTIFPSKVKAFSFYSTFGEKITIPRNEVQLLLFPDENTRLDIMTYGFMAFEKYFSERNAGVVYNDLTGEAEGDFRDDEDYLLDYEAYVTSFCKALNTELDPEKHSMIFYPRFVGIPGRPPHHFALLAANIETKTVYYFDPCGDIQEDQERASTAFLEAIVKVFKERAGPKDEWKITTPVTTKMIGIPIQGKSKYCGQFVLAYASGLMTGKFPSLEREMYGLRRQLVASIVEGEPVKVTFEY